MRHSIAAWLAKVILYRGATEVFDSFLLERPVVVEVLVESWQNRK